MMHCFRNPPICPASLENNNEVQLSVSKVNPPFAACRLYTLYTLYILYNIILMEFTFLQQELLAVWEFNLIYRAGGCSFYPG